jgi:hypothetical protein
MTGRAQLQVLAGILAAGALIFLLAGILVAADREAAGEEFIRHVTQRDIDDTIAEFIRDARDDFSGGAT